MASHFDGIVVVDEAYIDFTDMPSAVVLQEDCRNVVVLQTLSKAWGLAGLRVGICMADPELVIYLNKVKPPYNIGSLTQRRALDVLRNEADFWGRSSGKEKGLSVSCGIYLGWRLSVIRRPTSC